MLLRSCRAETIWPQPPRPFEKLDRMALSLPPEFRVESGQIQPAYAVDAAHVRHGRPQFRDVGALATASGKEIWLVSSEGSRGIAWTIVPPGALSDVPAATACSFPCLCRNTENWRQYA